MPKKLFIKIILTLVAILPIYYVFKTSEFNHEVIVYILFAVYVILAFVYIWVVEL